MATTITGSLTDANKTILDKLQNDTASNALKQKQAMGQDQFLHLITEQLKNQDPLSPMQDQQFIAQMAQLQSLESQNSLVQLTQANYVLSASMSENIKAMSDNIKTLVAKMTATTGTPGTTDTTNKDILNELVKMNKAMEGYFNK